MATARTVRPATVTAVEPRTEEAAAQLMWTHYRDHKQALKADIRIYRADILAQLMAGLPPDRIFAPYLKPAEPVPARRRAA